LRLYRRAPPPPYQPPWRGVFESWSRKWVARHYWRVQHIVDSKEDALQECGLVFAKCCRKYGDRVNNPAWFMALYIRAVMNTWNTLARRDEDERNTVAHTSTYDLEEYRVVNIGSSMAVSLLELSIEARRVLQTLITAPGEVIEYVMAGRHHRRDMINRRLLYILGFSRRQINAIDEVIDLVGKNKV